MLIFAAENQKTRIMCTVSVKVNEDVLREYNPELSSSAAISEWVQGLVDGRLAEMKAIHEQEFVEVDINSL